MYLACPYCRKSVSLLRTFRINYSCPKCGKQSLMRPIDKQQAILFTCIYSLVTIPIVAKLAAYVLKMPGFGPLFFGTLILAYAVMSHFLYANLCEMKKVGLRD